MKNEALRLFLAITALILTAMLTNPTEDGSSAAPNNFATRSRSISSHASSGQKHSKKVTLFKSSKKYRPTL